MTTDQAARQVHTGSEHCRVRPLHDPCHTGCSEDGRTLDDMTATSMWIAWRRQIRGTPAIPDDPYHPPGSCDACASPPGQVPLSAGRFTSLDEVLAIIELVDAHLDSSASPDYQAQPLARDWTRITKVCEEAGEVWKAQSKRTGENPRKGISGTTEELLGELGDTASAALCAIQHVTKDIYATWRIFLDALGKARSRVPGEPSFPPESGMTRQDATGNGITG